MPTLLLLLILADGPWQVPPESLPATLATLRQAADTAFAAPTPEHLAALRRAVGGTELVSGGRRYDIQWLHNAAETGDSRELFVARERLKAWERSLGDAPAEDPAQVSATARRILSDEAYQPVRATSWIDPWLPAIERFFDLLFAPLSRRGDEQDRGRDLAAVAIYGGLTLALAALLIRASRRRRRQVVDAAPESIPAAVSRRTAEDWRQVGRGERAAGRDEAALAAICRAAVRRLEETGRLTPRAGRTMHEAAAELAGPDAVALAALARQAEDVFYGGAAAADLAAAEGELERMWDQ